MRILIVKTSSMGDVVHALPAVSDMLGAQPGLQVDWLVEAPFAAIPRLHAGVQRVLPLAWRKWRKTLFAADTRAAMAALRGELRRERAERIAAGCGGVVPPFLTVAETAAVLGHARQIVGLDTGFSHLAAAFGAPTIGIYCDHEPGLAGITGPGPVASLGGKGQMPALSEVMAALELQLGASAG